jgi:hypothetical protein
MKADSLLLTPDEIEDGLGSRAEVTLAQRGGTAPAIGNVVREAAVDSAYRRFSGHLALDEGDVALAVTEMALVFDTATKADHTFDQVAAAAHLRTQVDGSDVAVETVTASSGLVSYWGFVHRREVIMILAIDTLDPQHLSVSDLRALVIRAARRLEAAGQA